MVEKFYYDILEQHLKQAEAVKPYREELERRAHDFQDYIDMQFEKPFERFYQEAETPEKILEKTLEQTPTDAGDPADSGKRIFGLTQSTIRELEEQCRIFTRLSAVSYLINSLVQKYSANNISAENFQKIQNEYKDANQSYKPFMQDFLKDKEKESSIDSYEKLSELKPTQVTKSSLTDKILVSLANGSNEFKNAFGTTTSTKDLLEKAVKSIDAEFSDMNKDPKFKIAATLNSFQEPSKNIIVHQLETQPYSPEQYEKFMKLGDSLDLKNFSKTFGKGGEFSALDSMSGGDITATDVLDILQQQGKYDEVMSGAFKAFSSRVSGIAEALSNAANKVFAGEVIGENPALQKTNEELLMDIINQHVFYNEAYKKETSNNKFWLEIETPNANVSQINTGQTTPQQVDSQIATQTQKLPAAPAPNVPPKAEDQKTEINTNALSQNKNNAIRQVTAMIVMTTVMSFLSSFAKVFSELVGKEVKPEITTMEEAVFTEGIIDFVSKSIGGTLKTLGGFLHNLTSIIPTDLNELNNKETFDKVTKVLLKQAKSGDFKSIMNQFNASKQSTSFYSKIFNPKVIQKNAGLIKQAVSKASLDTSSALNQFNETALQKIMQNAYINAMGKGGKAAYKMANVANKIGTKIQGL